MAFKLLQPAINVGLSEADFWDMTIAEVTRYIDGAVWRMKTQAQFNYILADLIGVSTARIMSNDVKMPTLEEAYPSLFEPTKQEVKQAEEEAKAIETSANRFLQFALQHNAKMREKE